MTKIKFCGLSRPCDIEAANGLMPEYIGFVFAPASKRYVTPERAKELKALLSSQISAVGVFVNERPERIAGIAEMGILELIQLHGAEDEAYIRRLRTLTDLPVIRAFSIAGERDVEAANESSADYVLLDAGKGGTGTRFDWSLLPGMRRPCFLAGGLDTDNAAEAVRRFHPYALDISSGIETDGVKDPGKMAAFAAAVRKAEGSGTG
ncbi:MAG TPA: phosphoribosylanthranilate isomerase [Candidatus Eisenbergiella merdavium]|uniref:N-(5'-phosphoribosyl)anthranilate isomerase n=1 Tax=Candidatus Eisenbergiella merdavium TaxID=2838551 RepID=A0A9D2NKA1_9FIRM|nr:phosphoribosylanthranilate isomerase [Candidatus Eisenbergiella merdavium]